MKKETKFFAPILCYHGAVDVGLHECHMDICSNNKWKQKG